MKCCNFDCSDFGAGHGVTFWRGEPTHVGDFHKHIIAACQPLYCKNEHHPRRGPLPGCTRWAEYGALVEWYAECSVTGITQEALF